MDSSAYEAPLRGICVCVCVCAGSLPLSLFSYESVCPLLPYGTCVARLCGDGRDSRWSVLPVPVGLRVAHNSVLYGAFIEAS